MALSTRIKICGITRVVDAEYIATLPVDAIGLVFHPASPRFIDIPRAKAIIQAVPAFTSVVGLFMDAPVALVKQHLAELALDILQFHGRETAAYCEQFNRRYIKSIPMLDQPDLIAYTAAFPLAAGFLLDAVQAGKAGGSGQSFDWTNIPAQLNVPIILAGGLNPDNVAMAIQQTGCYGVDVSSGVEAAQGIKDPAKIAQFVRQAKL